MVRPSIGFYPNFSLIMTRSLGFGFYPYNLRPIKTRFRYAYTFRLKLAIQIKSLTHYAKGTPSPYIMALTVCKHPVSGSISLPCSGFYFTFPSRYSFTIGHWVVFRLGWWSTHIQSQFLVLRHTFYTWYLLIIQDFHLLRSAFPYSSNLFLYHVIAFSAFARHYLRNLVLISFLLVT